MFTLDCANLPIVSWQTVDKSVKKVIKTARISESDNFVIDQCSLQTTPGRIIP